MAYGSGNKFSGQKSRPVQGNTAVNTATAMPTGAAKPTSETVFKTGLFLSPEGSKSLASVQIRETVTIPAGSYINLFHNTDKKGESSPDYSLNIRSGVLRSK